MRLSESIAHGVGIIPPSTQKILTLFPELVIYFLLAHGASPQSPSYSRFNKQGDHHAIKK